MGIHPFFGSIIVMGIVGLGIIGFIDSIGLIGLFNNLFNFVSH